MPDQKKIFAENRQMIQTAAVRVRQLETMLALHFSNTRNPAKLLWSRVSQPGAIRRSRKAIQAELSLLKNDLKKMQAQPAVVAEPQRTTESGVRHHIVISGTGRAGTTFLMELLTTLGLDTGFENCQSLIDLNAHAGLERNLRKSDLPYIIKSPHLCDQLDDILAYGKVTLDHLFIPVREISAAARSRAQVQQKADAPEGTSVNGGFWQAQNLEEQETVLRQKLSDLIVTVAKFDIPCTLLSFPRLVDDPDYLFEKLAPALRGMKLSTFKKGYREVARPALVSRKLGR